MNEKIATIRNFIKSQKLYMWLVVFILIIQAVSMFLSMTEKMPADGKKSLFPPSENLAEQKAAFEAKFRNNKTLTIMIVLTLMMAALIILIGFILDIVILFFKINKKTFIQRALPMPAANWTIWDVSKVIILFIFFGYALTLIESILSATFPFIKTQKSLRMAFNTTVLDILAISFILYFVIGEHKHRLKDLGISFRNFFRNLFYGLIGYIAAIPILIMVLLFLVWIVSVLGYKPPPQPVLELLVEEKNLTALAYISVFVGILGPIAEEMFFRGFMYTAIRKQLGIGWALVASSVLFAFLHVHLVGFLPIMILGLVLAYLYEKTGSLIASITVHIIHNTAMIYIVFLMKEIYF